MTVLEYIPREQNIWVDDGLRSFAHDCGFMRPNRLPHLHVQFGLSGRSHLIEGPNSLAPSNLLEFVEPYEWELTGFENQLQYVDDTQSML